LLRLLVLFCLLLILRLLPPSFKNGEGVSVII
jgi:hypothetical protein